MFVWGQKALKPIKSQSDDLNINVQMLPICWESLQEIPGEILQSWMCQAICDESKKSPQAAITVEGACGKYWLMGVKIKAQHFQIRLMQKLSDISQKTQKVPNSWGVILSCGLDIKVFF